VRSCGVIAPKKLSFHLAATSMLNRHAEAASVVTAKFSGFFVHGPIEGVAIE
jgi:hypothetical protein